MASYFILKTFKIKEDDFYLSPKRWRENENAGTGQIRFLIALEKVIPYMRALGTPLLRENICNTLGLLQSLFPTKDWPAAEVKSECCSSMINSCLSCDRGRDLRSPGAVDVFCRTWPWRIRVWWISAVLPETQGWNHAWWERAVALRERNARGRGCTRRRVEEAHVRQQLRKQAAGRW